MAPVRHRNTALPQTRTYAPQRDTVAGEAAAMESTSMTSVMLSRSVSVSPLLRHSVRLSSSTGFSASTHTWSTGPSMTSHALCVFWGVGDGG